MKTDIHTLRARAFALPVVSLIAGGVALASWAGAAESGDWAAPAPAETALARLSDVLRTSNTRAVIQCYESLPESTRVPDKIAFSVAERYRSAGQYAEARVLYEGLLKANPADEDAKRGLVMALFAAGQYVDAMRILDQTARPPALPLPAKPAVSEPVPVRTPTPPVEVSVAPAALAGESAVPEPSAKEPPVLERVPEAPPVPAPDVDRQRVPEPPVIPEPPAIEPADDAGPPSLNAPEPQAEGLMTPPRPEPAAEEVIEPAIAETGAVSGTDRMPPGAEARASLISPEAQPKPDTSPTPVPEERAEDPAVALAKALDLFETGRRQLAMDVLLDALSLHPNDTHLLYTKAQIHRANGELPEAAVACDRILDLYPGDENALALKVRLLVSMAERSKGTDALKFYEEALASSGQDPQILYGYVLALCSAGRVEDAISRFEQLPSDLADAPEMVRAIGPCYREAKRYDKACQYYKMMVERDPSDLETGKALIAMLSGLKKPDEVLAAADLVLSAHPNDVEVLYTKATIHQKRGEVDEALAACDRILAVEPQYPVATDLKVQLLVAKATMVSGEDAKTLLREARKLTDDDPEVIDVYIQLLCGMAKENGVKERKEAIALFEALPKDYTPTDETVKGVAKCYFDAREFRRARPLYEAMLKKDPNDQTALRGLVTLLFNLGEYHRAVETLSEATLTPADIPTRPDF